MLSIVDYHRPDYLLSCGDWGTAVTPEEFYELLQRVVILTIYGNHENMSVLTRVYNVKMRKYLPILMIDGKVYDVGGLRVAGINGIVAKKRKTKKGVPRKTPEEYVAIAMKLRDKNIDVLLIHETPFLPKLFPKMSNTLGAQVALKAVETIKPHIVVNGHIHSNGYKVCDLPWHTKYFYIDSSQQHRHYLVLSVHDTCVDVEVWKDTTCVNVYTVC